MNRDEMMKRIRADAFPANNGSVLTCINLLNRSGFSPYIETRTIEGRISGADLADYNYDELEARASEKGIRLMQGSLTDECVKV